MGAVARVPRQRLGPAPAGQVLPDQQRQVQGRVVLGVAAADALGSDGVQIQEQVGEADNVLIRGPGGVGLEPFMRPAEHALLAGIQGSVNPFGFDLHGQPGGLLKIFEPARHNGLLPEGFAFPGAVRGLGAEDAEFEDRTRIMQKLQGGHGLVDRVVNVLRQGGPR